LPLHPFLVHFPIAAWVLGSLVLPAGLLLRKPGLIGSAWLMLALGAAFSIPAALSGQAQFFELGEAGGEALERHRSLGNLLPWLMIGLLLLRAHVRFARKAPAIPDWIWSLAVLAVAALLLFVGLLGGELVYRWGILTAAGVTESPPLAPLH